IRDLPSHFRQLSGNTANTIRLLLGATESVEDATLRFAVQQGLRVVLAVKVDELPPDLGQHGGRHGSSIYPGAPAAARGDLALENERVIVDFNSALISQRRYLLQFTNVEDTFPRRLVGTGADQISAGALAEQQTQRANDDRLPRTGLPGEHVEAGRQRQRNLLNDGEVPNAQLSHHQLG